MVAGSADNSKCEPVQWLGITGHRANVTIRTFQAFSHAEMHSNRHYCRQHVRLEVVVFFKIMNHDGARYSLPDAIDDTINLSIGGSLDLLTGFGSLEH